MEHIKLNKMRLYTLIPQTLDGGHINHLHAHHGHLYYLLALGSHLDHLLTLGDQLLSVWGGTSGCMYGKADSHCSTRVPGDHVSAATDHTEDTH